MALRQKAIRSRMRRAGTRFSRSKDAMETLVKDIQYALRTMRKSPAFAVAVILTLALGIGANTAIFSIVNAVLLRSLPHREPDRLVKITFDNPGVGLHDVPYSVPEWDDLKSR